MALAALALALLLAEAAARRFSMTYQRMHSPPLPFFEANPLRKAGLVPGYRGRMWGSEFRVNALGFRGPEITPAKPPGVYRILVLGDSIVMGVGLPEPALVSHQLALLLRREHPELVFQVINGGISGYGIEEERLLLHEKGFGLHPDAVAVVFCVNDLPDISIGDQVNPRRDLPVPGKHWLSSHSALALMIEGLYSQIGLRKLGRLGAFLAADRSPKTQARFDRAWAAYEAELARMAAECRDRGIILILLAVPHEVQFEDARKRFIPQARLRAITQRLSLPFIDPAPEFAALPHLPYILLDPVHPSPEGHEIMARMIADSLRPSLP